MSIQLPLRPMASLRQAFKQVHQERQQCRRAYATQQVQKPSYARLHDFHPGDIYRGKREQAARLRALPVPDTKPAIKKICPDPVSVVTDSQLALLDPTGARTRLFHPDNDERINPGDIILVRLANAEPVSGVVMSIRRRTPIDTAVLLRNQLLRVGVEVWVKVYSPNVTGIELVRRSERRPRRARLYYLRKPRHDMGSLEGVVRQHIRARAGVGQAKPGRPAMASKGPTKGKKK